MIVHLDANFLMGIYSGADDERRRAAAWIRKNWELHVSAVAWSEYLCGPLGLEEEQTTRTLVSAVLPLAEADAELGAHLFNVGGRRKRSLPDCLIAATAIRAGAPLATANRADFERFTAAGLRLA